MGLHHHVYMSKNIVMFLFSSNFETGSSKMRETTYCSRVLTGINHPSLQMWTNLR